MWTGNSHYRTLASRKLESQPQPVLPPVISLQKSVSQFQSMWDVMYFARLLSWVEQRQLTARTLGRSLCNKHRFSTLYWFKSVSQLLIFQTFLFDENRPKACKYLLAEAQWNSMESRRNSWEEMRCCGHKIHNRRGKAESVLLSQHLFCAQAEESQVETSSAAPVAEQTETQTYSHSGGAFTRLFLKGGVNESTNELTIDFFVPLVLLVLCFFMSWS